MPISSSDTNQLLLWSGNPTPAKFCENVPQKDGSPACQCGKGMSGCSIHPNTRDEWIASMQDSLASLIQSQVFKQVLATREAAKCGAKQNASFATLDLDMCSWRTYQDLFNQPSQECQPTFTKSGMTLNGCAYQLPSLAHHIADGDGGGLLPTPSGTSNHGKNHVSGRLDEWGGSSNPWRGTKIGKVHCAAFEEWMLGLPFRWTELTEYETPKSRYKPQPHGDSLEVSET